MHLKQSSYTAGPEGIMRVLILCWPIGPALYRVCAACMGVAPVAVCLGTIVLLEPHEAVYTGHNQTPSLCLCRRMPPVTQRDRPKASLFYLSSALLDAFMS